MFPLFQTTAEILEALDALTIDQQLSFMFALGYNLTVVARSAYPDDIQDGNIALLVALNELQHRVYGRTASLKRGKDWTMSSFLDFMTAAKEGSINADIIWAFHRAYEQITNKAPEEVNG